MEKPIESLKALGRHILLELYPCDSRVLTDRSVLEAALVKAAVEAGAHVVETVFHQFNPHGLSGVVVIAESHVAVHTWPEHGYAAVDVFTCGDAEIAERICDGVITAFAAERVVRKGLDRGPQVLVDKKVSAPVD